MSAARRRRLTRAAGGLATAVVLAACSAAPGRGTTEVVHPADAGAGVMVYVFDGGVSGAHPELQGRVRRGFTPYPGDAPICNGHGTAVAGAAAGRSAGAAPGAEIVDVKIIDCWRMDGPLDGILEAVRWVLKDAARHPGRRAVANWSFMVDTGSVPALDSAVASLVRAGIPVVVSAGNLERDACRIAPANVRSAITVGASSAAPGTVPRRVRGTAFGRCVDVYAHADEVVLPGFDAAGRPDARSWSGTSVAAAHVSGLAARYLATHPAATTDDVARHVTAAAEDVALASR